MNQAPPVAADAMPSGSAPTQSTFTESAPAPSAPRPVPVPRKWPSVLVWTAVGVEVIGAAFAAGGLAATRSSTAEMNRSWPTLMAKGCGAGTPGCATYAEAKRASETAGTIGEVGFAISTFIAISLFSAGLLGYWTDPAGNAPAANAPAKQKPISIEVAPTVGGTVIRGTF